MGGSEPTGEGAAVELEKGSVDGQTECNCEIRLKAQPTELENRPVAVGLTEELSKQEAGLTGSLETGAKLGEEDQLDGNVFWQLLGRAGYTRW